jgi:hypothetical protein
MNRQVKITIGIGLSVLLLASVFATAAFAQGPGSGFGGTMGGQGFGGMMGGRGYGPGMMGGQWSDGKFSGGCPMFGGAAVPANAQPIRLDKASEAVQQYLKSFNNSDLELAEVMEFDNNFYAVVTDKSTGAGAFELLVNRYTGFVSPEPGPNMMWNTQYGHMAGFGGMMGGMMRGRFGRFQGQQQGPVTVTVAEARAAAQQWLDANLPGAVLADDEVQFPGYYTLDFLKDGETAGMLSVNGYTGQVWVHTWHGNLISEQEF